MYSREWQQRAFLKLSDGERLTVLYCRTGPQSTSYGACRLSSAIAVEDLGNVTVEEFDQRRDAVVAALGWRFDQDTRVLWIPDWLEVNPPQSPKAVIGWARLIHDLPDCDLKDEVIEAIRSVLKKLVTIEGQKKSFLESFERYYPPLPKEQPKHKPKPERIQGTGIQGSSGSQGDREQVGAARRPMALTKNEIPDDLIQLAKTTVADLGSDASDEEIIDHLQWIARPRDLKRASAIAALASIGFRGSGNSALVSA